MNPAGFEVWLVYVIRTGAGCAYTADGGAIQKGGIHRGYCADDQCIDVMQGVGFQVSSREKANLAQLRKRLFPIRYFFVCSNNHEVPIPREHSAPRGKAYTAVISRQKQIFQNIREVPPVANFQSGGPAHDHGMVPFTIDARGTSRIHELIQSEICIRKLHMHQNQTGFMISA